MIGVFWVLVCVVLVVVVMVVVCIGGRMCIFFYCISVCFVCLSSSVLRPNGETEFFDE